MSFVGVRAGKALGIPVVHTEHGSGFVVSNNPIIRVMSRVVDQTLGKYVLQHARQVLAVSEQVAAFVMRLSRRQATIFYNAVHLPELSGQTPVRTHNRLVFVGRIVEGKGWQLALEVSSQIYHDRQLEDFEAFFIGDGAQLSSLRNEVQGGEASKWVRVLGRIPPDEVPNWLRGAILINPTQLSEGFQTTLLEAVMNGARVVTSRAPGTQLLLSQGAAIYIVDGIENKDWVEAVYAAVNADAPNLSTTNFDFWSWQFRAAEYERLCLDTIAQFRDDQSRSLGDA